MPDASSPQHRCAPRPLLQLAANVRGRDWVVGDIHGCFDALSAALDALNFDPATDRVLSVGDLVDRGPDSEAAFDWLDYPWFIAIRGNHEAMAVAATGALLAFAAAEAAAREAAVRALQDGKLTAAAEELREDITAIAQHLANGGAWLHGFLQGGGFAHISRLAQLPLAIEVATPDGRRIGLSHADIWSSDWSTHCDALAAGHSRAEAMSLWSRRRADLAIKRNEPRRTTPGRERGCHVTGIDHLVLGHTVVKQGPTRLANVTFIDTGACFAGGHLTCLPLSNL